MKVVRQIVYESESQGALDRQLGKSLPDGERAGMNEPNSAGVKITIRTLHDERVKVDEFPDETAKAVRGEDQPPCPCDVCKKVRAIRADVAANGVDGIADQLTNFTTEELTRTEPTEYHPTTQDESESTEGCN